MSHFLLRCFSQGAAIADIAGLTNHKPDEIEHAIRADIRRMLEVADASIEAQPIPKALRKSAPVTPYEPKNFVRPEPGTVITTDEYPEELREPRCTAMRAIWDVLAAGPLSIDQMFEKGALASRDMVYQTINRLRGLGLVMVVDDNRPAKWKRVERPKD